MLETTAHLSAFRIGAGVTNGDEEELRVARRNLQLLNSRLARQRGPVALIAPEVGLTK